MKVKKTFFTLGAVFFVVAVVFAIFFIWTLDVSTSYRYIRNFYGTSVVTDITETEEYFQDVYAIMSIVSTGLALIFTILGIWFEEIKKLFNRNKEDDIIIS